MSQENWRIKKSDWNTFGDWGALNSDRASLNDRELQMGYCLKLMESHYCVTRKG